MKIKLAICSISSVLIHGKMMGSYMKPAQDTVTLSVVCLSLLLRTLS